MSGRKKRKRMHGTVTKLIPSHNPGDPEKAQIDVHDAEPLYREIRVENELTDGDGAKTRLEAGTEVEVVIEAAEDGTPSTPKHSHRRT